MCPVCLAAAALIAGSTTGTGGITAVVVRVLRKRRSEDQSPMVATKEENDGIEPFRSSSPQNGFPC